MDTANFIPIYDDYTYNTTPLIILYVFLFIILGCILYILNKMYIKFNTQNNNNQYDLLLYKLNENYKQENNNNINNNNINHKINQEKINININKDEKNLMTPFDFMREYDYRTLNDPLVEPRRRDDYNLPVLPLPTRGFPAAFKKMGILVNEKANDNDKFKFLLLMGRNKFPSSNVYNYYAVDNDKNSALKFNIHKTRELQTGDHIHIQELHNEYKVMLDKTLGYEYDPYIY